MKFALGSTRSVGDEPGTVFLDSYVLIAAARGDHAHFDLVTRFLATPRRLVSSRYVQLEVLPKAYDTPVELRGAESLFRRVVSWVPASDLMVGRAIEIARTSRLRPLDALHAAAAMIADATLVTLDLDDRFTKVPGLRVEFLRLG